MGSPVYGAVQRVEPLGPHMVRVVFGGPGLAGFEAVEWTDAYVNLLFVPAEAPYSVPFDLEQARALPRDQWPIPRRFSVRRWDAARCELWVDFVVHGDVGTAGRWAARAQPGQLLQFGGPSGAYRPDPSADWHLMVGDETALPAIAAALERIPPGRPVLFVGLVDGPEDEQPLDCPGELQATWMHRDATPGAEDLLARAVEKLDFPVGRVHGFVHGEAVETRAVRRHLLGERGLDRDALSLSPYWRRTFTDEAWREVKSDWLAEVETDV